MAKTRYFYSNEQDRILSLDEIREEFEEFQQEGYYTDEPFQYYLQNCMYWNNGDLTPIIDRYDSLRKKLAKVENLAWSKGNKGKYGIIIIEPSTEFDEWINEIKLKITELVPYL